MSRIDNFWINKNITNFDASKKCCGCEVCSNVCPKQAIDMVSDQEGFLYPKIDESKCVNCSLCLTVCPELKQKKQKNKFINLYAGFSNNRHILNQCASGGFVTELSNYILESGGVVFGVKYDDALSGTVYDWAEKPDEVKMFSSSKYVQSKKNDIFKIIENELKKNKRLVLFTGCPCDVAALISYLNFDYTNLVTCELFCAGVTSPKILEEYKTIVEKKHKSKLIDIEMRSKRHGWYVSSLEEHYQNGKIFFHPLYGSLLGHAFEVFIRPSCLECSFRGEGCNADFKVGDFWGIKTSDSFWNADGVSCIISSSSKGDNIIKEMSTRMNLTRVDNHNRLDNNQSLHSNKSIKYVNRRNKFSKALVDKGLAKACRSTSNFSYVVKKIVPLRLQPKIKILYHRFIDK